MTKIYLVTNCYGDPNKVYIGKTINDSREGQHRKKYGEHITFDYIDEINSTSRKEWEPLETFWIEQFRQWGFEIVNKRKKGGSGPEYHTKETCDKISQKLKGKNKSEESTAKKRKPKPEGFGDKISNHPERGSKIIQANKLHYIPGSDRNKKIKDALIGKKQPNISKALFGLSKPEGFGDKISNHPERGSKIKEKNSKSVTQIMSNEEMIQYLSITEASKQTGIHINSISLCCLGKQKRAGGYVWRFTKDLLY